MNVILKYIDEDGSIKTDLYKVIHNIKEETQLNILKNEVIKKYADSIIVLRGLSDFTYLNYTKSTLKTLKYNIDIKSNNMNFLTLNEPCYGSAIECISRNATLYTQIESQRVQKYFDNIRINFVKNTDSIFIPLTEIRSNGFISHLYEMKVFYADDWSPTCSTCTNGMLYLKNEISKLSNELYVNPSNDFELSGKIIEDLNVYDSSVLTQQIGILLKNAIDNAKIQSFEIIEIPGEKGDEK